ncbi:hypothetical protein JCM8208_007000 [Rhodotorula glutinis]
MHYPPVPYPPCITTASVDEHSRAPSTSSEAASSGSPPATDSTQSANLQPPTSPRTARSPFKRPAPTSSPSPDARLTSSSRTRAPPFWPAARHVNKLTWSEPVSPSKRLRAPAGLPFKAPQSVSSPASGRSSKRRKGALKEGSTTMSTASKRTSRSLATPPRASSPSSPPSSPSPSSSPTTSPFPTSRPFPTPTRTTSALVADYRAALADEAAFRGITEDALRESIKRREEDEGEDELRPLEVELRDKGWLAPREGGSKRGRAARSTADGDDGAAPSSSSSSSPPASTQPSPAKRTRTTAAASTLRKAFRTPRPLERPPSPSPPPSKDDDELVAALDRAIAATPVRYGGGGGGRGSARQGEGTRAGAAAGEGAGAGGAAAPAQAGS